MDLWKILSHNLGTAILVLLGIGLWWDFRKDKSRHLAAKLVQFAFLTTLTFVCNFSIPVIIECLRRPDQVWETLRKSSIAYQASVPPAAWIDVIQLTIHILAFLMLVLTLLMSQRIPLSRKLFMILYPVILTLSAVSLIPFQEVASFFLDTFEIGFQVMNLYSVLWQFIIMIYMILALSLILLLGASAFVYSRPFMISFFNRTLVEPEIDPDETSGYSFREEQKKAAQRKPDFDIPAITQKDLKQ